MIATNLLNEKIQANSDYIQKVNSINTNSNLNLKQQHNDDFKQKN